MVSVIIPTFNRYELLKQTILSVLNQSYDKLEVIIVDDGSTDDTKEMIDSIKDKRLRYFSLGRTKNVSKLRNFGVFKAKYDLIAFCDDDDLWFSDKIEKCLVLVEKYDFICSNMNKINIYNEIVSIRYFDDIFKDTVITTEMLLLRNYVLTSTMFFKKFIFDIFRFDEEYYISTAEDYALCLDISTKYSIFFIYENTGSYRIHENLSNEYFNRLKLIKNEHRIVSSYKKNKTLKKNAIMGAFNFNLELFQWYLKNKYYLNSFKQFFKLIFDLRFFMNSTKLLNILRIKLFKK